MKKFTLSFWFRWVTAIVFIAQFIISWRMWISYERLFPKVFTFGFLEINLPISLEVILMALTCVSLILFALRKLELVSIIVFVLSVFFMVADDLIRFQPWLFLHGILLVFHYVVKDPVHFKRLFILILSGLFIWAGLLKFNISFLTNTWAFLWSGYTDNYQDMLLSTEQLESINSLSELPMRYWKSSIIPITEILAGLLLILPKSRKVGAVLGMLTQIGILFFIGPWAKDWNHVIWPWNIELFIFFLWLVRDKTKLFERVNWLSVVTIVAFFFLPILTFFRMWDNHLSGSLYSGRNPTATLFMPNYEGEVDDMFYSDLIQNREIRNRIVYVNVDLWCMYDLDAPLYPQERYFKRFGEIFSNGIYKDKMCKLELHFKHNFNSKIYVKIMTFYNGSLISEKSI